MNNKKIGIFDSGVGGLTVFKEIRHKLPNEDLIYIGDTKRFPYGNKSKESIIQISKQIIEYLLIQDVKLVVIACGTATSQALDTLQKVYDIPIMGIIEPTIENQIDHHTKSVGIIATRGTIKSNEWERQIRQKNPNITVINQAALLLAPMAEEGWIDNKVANEAIKEYTKPFLGRIEKLILGCTHYPLFSKLLKKQLGEKIQLINTGEEIAKQLKQYLTKHQMEQQASNKGNNEIYLTDIECNFVNIAKQLLGDDIRQCIEKLQI